MQATFATLFVVPFLAAAPAALAEEPAASATWSFAVSGDSRDCGDLVMPKIARGVLEEKGPATDLYWHLGDFRRIYDIDCDILKRTHPDFDCAKRSYEKLGDLEMSDYLNGAWSDFVERQVKPFGRLPVYLGIGNHELYGRTRDEFRRVFQPWLAQMTIHAQRQADSIRGIFTMEGETSYHFVHKNVDFIFLDNADENAFTPKQLVWLGKVLAQDAKDDAVKAIVVGLHAALPYSTARGHAMDATCQGRCSGQQAYDLLFRAQALAGPPEKRKRVYVLASHSHLFAEGIYDTPEHRGQVLPGWIVGTAGAQQYRETIGYGYLRVVVSPDGTFTTTFRDVTRTSPPLAEGPGADSLTDFCFTENKRKPGQDAVDPDCACVGARSLQ